MSPLRPGADITNKSAYGRYCCKSLFALVSDRDRMAILLVGDLDFGTKGQRFVRRRHDVLVERDAAEPRSMLSTFDASAH